VELRATRIVGCWLISTEWGKRLRDGGEACWEGLFRGWRGCDVAILLYVTDSYGWFLAYERKAASQLPNPGNLQQTKTAGFPDEVLLSTILDGGRRAGWRRFSWSCFDPLQACVLPIIHTDRQPRCSRAHRAEQNPRGWQDFPTGIRQNGRTPDIWESWDCGIAGLVICSLEHLTSITRSQHRTYVVLHSPWLLRQHYDPPSGGAQNLVAAWKVDIGN